MKRLKPTRLMGLTAAVALMLAASQVAYSAPFTVSYLAAGVQTPNFPTACTSGQACFYGTETFSTWNGGAFNSTFTTGLNNFTASTYINGVYSSNNDPNWKKVPADLYGGSGGTAPYPLVAGPTAPGSAYAVKLTHSADIPGLNYFGLWISALDQSNDLQFYNNGQLIYSFGAPDLQAALGTCSAAGGYCGNPTPAFKGQNPNENYAYVNFFDTVGYFDQVLLYSTSAGFESSNHSVAYIKNIAATGTTFTTQDRPASAAFNAKIATLIPEPASVMLVFTALVVLLFRYHRRRAAQAEAERSPPEIKRHRRRRRRNLSRTRPGQMGWPAGAPSRFNT